MKNNLTKFAYFIVFASCLSLLGCSHSNGDEEYNKYPHGIVGEYYNSSWKPSKNGLKDATQPKIKNPKGLLNTYNDIKRSQQQIGLPSQGEANILVVPLTFDGDDYDVSSYDLTFSENDLDMLNELYFGKERIAYPSVSSYYKTSSFNKLNLSGVVTPIVTFNKSFLNFIGQAVNGGKSLSELHYQLVDYVYNYLFNETKTYYIGDFDSDNDRRIDTIQIILNYPHDYKTNNELYDQVITPFLNYENIYFYNEKLGNNPINSYAFFSDSYRKLESEKGNYSRIAVYQNAKILGIPDYSDLTLDITQKYQRAPLAYKDMMDGFVGDHNVFTKYLLGWINPQIISSESIIGDDLEITIKNSDKNPDALLLHTGNHNTYGEYLLIDLYSGNNLNYFDRVKPTIFGTQTFTKTGLRIYRVNSGLIKMLGGNVTPFTGQLDFNEFVTSFDGKKQYAKYDFMHTNNGVNNYYSYGISDNSPLISLLDRNGLNRHLISASSDLFSTTYSNDTFLWQEGDTFATSDQLDGFYHDYQFSKGDYLNIEFEITSLNASEAKLNLWRAK